MTNPPSRNQALYRQARARVPGGTHLFSKRPELFAPGCWPAYFESAAGCRVRDIDGNEYLDFAHNGVGACLLGYAHPEVNAAVHARIGAGVACSLNPPEEVELAARLCAIHPWAERVRLARGGGEACAMAVRIARAATGRDIVAVCGYHGWHDWYLAANLGEEDALAGHLLPGLAPAGVPQSLRGTTLAFHYNDLEEFQAVLDRAGNRLAAVVMEPCRHHDPAPGFLEAIRDKTHAAGALLVFDEVTIGWRLCFGGAHLRLGVAPDMAVFSKALGNGFPIAAVIGSAAAMESAQNSFLSSTVWTEAVGPAAGLATLEVMERHDVAGHAAWIGDQVTAVWRTAAERHALPVEVGEGYPCLATFSFQHEEATVLRTLFTRKMLERGFLAGAAFYPTLAHTHRDVEQYAKAADIVFAELRGVLDAGPAADALDGPPAHEGFARLT